MQFSGAYPITASSCSPGVNFINIFVRLFTYILALAKVQKHFGTKKCARKVLMKMTPGVNFINNLRRSQFHQHFMQAFFVQNFCTKNYKAETFAL
jgi:hypothetical protein